MQATAIPLFGGRQSIDFAVLVAFASGGGGYALFLFGFHSFAVVFLLPSRDRAGRGLYAVASAACLTSLGIVVLDAER